MGVKENIQIANGLRDIEKKMLEQQNEAIEENRKYMKNKMEELEKMMLDNIRIIVGQEMTKQLKL